MILHYSAKSNILIGISNHLIGQSLLKQSRKQDQQKEEYGHCQIMSDQEISGRD